MTSPLLTDGAGGTIQVATSSPYEVFVVVSADSIQLWPIEGWVAVMTISPLAPYSG